MNQKEPNRRELNKRKIAGIVSAPIFAVIIAFCSIITIPSAIPFSMQSLGIFLCLGFLGGRRGTVAIALYLALGAIGLPVFSGGGAGIATIAGPTGGYLLGWIVAGLCVMLFEGALGRSLKSRTLGMSVGLVVCYLLGAGWYTSYMGIETEALWVALTTCVFPFVALDILKLCLAVYLCKRMKKFTIIA